MCGARGAPEVKGQRGWRHGGWAGTGGCRTWQGHGRTRDRLLRPLRFATPDGRQEVWAGGTSQGGAPREPRGTTGWPISSSGPSSSSRPVLILPAHPHPPLPRTGCLSSEKVSCTSSVALKRNCSLRRETLVFRYFSLIGVFACDILRYRTFGFGAGSPAKLPLWEGWGLDTASQFRLTQSWNWALLCSQLGKSCKQEGQTMKILGFFLSVA